MTEEQILRVLEDLRAGALSSAEALAKLRSLPFEDLGFANIDHHRSGRSFGHVNLIDPKAVATAELIYKLAKAADVTISPEVATCLYSVVTG